MVRSAAILTFIGLCAAFAVYVAMQQTVIKGEVMAANMLEQVKDKGVAKVVCDERIPVGKTGATFTCSFEGTDGSTARFEYKMDRAGKLESNMLASTPPTRRPPSAW